MKPIDTSSAIQTAGSAEETTHPESHLTSSTSTPPDKARPIISVPRPSVKPVSQKEIENPREYQITQIVRRHSPFRADLDDKSTLKFRLTPTDPDFPFELETGLHCVLNVPLAYPQNGRPSLEIHNPDMPRGFQINVEKGFDSLVEQQPGKSLLALLNELDKNLEKFLSSAKATTVKFVAPVREKQVVKDEPVPPVSQATQHSFSHFVPPRYSSDQLKEAKARRDVEIRQLEARLGRSENFSKAGDGIAFNVPIQLPSADKVPPSLRSLRETALIVPEVYPLEPCTIILRGVEGDEAENVELAFEKRVVSSPQLSLMAHINYLIQNLGKLSVDTRPMPELVKTTDDEDDGAAKEVSSDSKAEGGIRDPNRPHLRFIARPPEWNTRHDQGSADVTDSSDYDSDDDDIGEDEDSELESTAGGADVPTATGPVIEKGISISFPGLDIKGIELLEMTNLSINIKCERCKQMAEIKDIKPSKSDGTSQVHRAETCTKCTISFTFTYRPEHVHINNSRAGHIDLENCTIINLLPSIFQPTCASCSTVFPNPPGVTTIPGDTSLTICRTCHSKMTLHIPDVKFLRISTTTTTGTTILPLRSRKSRDPLHGTLTANTPLPDNGNCQHYAHSHRWFRFTCCNTVYPCDKCHDTSPTQKTDPHPNEHADRMICGWCSREQRYHPDICRFCQRSVVKGGAKGVSGFWEGGKGTRDKNLMRRKEGRKFKRGPGERKADEERRRKRKEGKGRGGMWWPG